METFFILLAVIFIPFVWFIVRVLRYTDNTIGENSPVLTIRTYHFSARQYFVQFEKCMLAILLVVMPLLAWISFNAAIQQDMLVGYFLCLVFLASTAFIAFYFYFDWQYWTITRNVSITLNPFQPSITVQSPTRDWVLTPDSVLRIEEHIKDPRTVSKLMGGYGYFLIYTVDNQIVQVNSIFLSGFVYTEFLERFFSNTPRTIIWHTSTWTTDLDYVRKSESPNFATHNQR